MPVAQVKDGQRQSGFIYCRARKALNHATPVSSVSLFAPYRFIKILTRENSDGANGALRGFLRRLIEISPRGRISHGVEYDESVA